MPRIIPDVKLDYKDVLIIPRRNTFKSRSEVKLPVEITFLHSKRTYRGIPIMASNMDNVGTFEMAKALSKHELFTVIQKFYTVEEWKSFAAENRKVLDHVAVSSGLGDEDYERLRSILDAIPELSFIYLYVANAYSDYFVKHVKKVRSAYPNHTIMVASIGTTLMTHELILAGADIISIGLGSGSVCTTRAKAAIGYPQLSAVMECADVAHALNAHIIADGGCTCVADFAKAFGGGADFVMAGGLFAGHDQGGGEIIEKNGKQYRTFYGMCSATAMKKHYGGVAAHRSTEGKTVEVPYKGDVEDTVLDILNGIRSTCSYVGASGLQELPERTVFVRCTQTLNNMFNNSG